jgi:signal transduction histidine kinase/DNA-binding response OmpR family regulator
MRRPSNPDDAQDSLRDKIIGLGERSIRKSYYPELHRRIGELEEARQELAESQSRLTAILDGSPVPQFVIGRDHRILLWNKAMEKYSGFKAADAVGTDRQWCPFYEAKRPTLADLLVEKRADDQEILRCYGGKTARSKLLDGAYEGVSYFPAMGQGGSWLYFTASVITDADGEVMGAVETLVDVTEQKRIEEELEQHRDNLEDLVATRTRELALARDAAESANRAKSQFLANMSHELRTPLNAILGFSSLMRREPDVTANLKEKLDIINRSGEHLLALINDVLEMAKIEAGRLQLECAPFDLGCLVRDVTDMMRLRAQRKGLTLLLDQSSSFPRFIRGDEARLRQILVNLVGNAVKFTEFGGVTLRLGTRQNDHLNLVMEIEDTGIGIGREDQERLFQPFTQLGGPRAGEGSGLGLTITRQVVELMGGFIGIKSTPGQGSIFRVELPVELAGETIVTERSSTRPAEAICGLAPGQPVFRILIVEDQLENQMLLTKLMANIGIEAKLAVNGEDAVALFQEWHPHLIWMDRRMPVMDGIEATRRIRQLPGGREVKIVAVTASAFEEQRQELQDAGMDDFVRKPYRIHEIYDCLAKQLGVTYLTHTDAPGPQEPVELTAETLVRLPASLRTDLQAALESLDRRSIADAIGRVRDLDPGLANTLARLARSFDYAAILAGLKAAESGGDLS